MDTVNSTKINKLMKSWPPDAVMTTECLVRQMGYTLSLIRRYHQSGWLNRIGRGAYLKLNDQLTLSGAVNALQQQLGLSIHLGGLTALEFQGISHYLAPSQSKDKVQWLFNSTNEHVQLPAWFKQNFPHAMHARYHLFIKKIPSLKEVNLDTMPIVVAIPERAILEVLALVPTRFSYAHACELVEGLQLLRPDVLNQLLTSCSSVKVKRLFLYLAEKYQLPCFKRLDKQAFDLGKGKRVIGEGGHYVSQYQLSVPKSDSGEDEEGVGYV